MQEEQIKTLLAELPNTAHGQAVRTYLSEKIDELDSVSDCKTWDETLGRQNAVKIMEELLRSMNIPRIDKKKKNQYV